MSEEGRSADYPECDSKIPEPSAEDIGFIGSSQSVGFGHEQSENRLPPVGEFPNTESGTGKSDTPSNSSLF